MEREALDLTSEPASGVSGSSRIAGGVRPFVGIHFACCNAYVRVYPASVGQKKVLNCPRCARALHVEFSDAEKGTAFRQIS